MISKDISPKLNVMVWREFELAFCNATIHQINHYGTEIPPCELEHVCFGGRVST